VLEIAYPTEFIDGLSVIGGEGGVGNESKVVRFEKNI
jgi:hypothetical protein